MYIRYLSFFIVLSIGVVHSTQSVQSVAISNASPPTSDSPEVVAGKQFIQSVIEKTGLSMIPDNDFLSLASIALQVPHTSKNQSVICLDRTSGNRIYRLHSHNKQAYGLVTNPIELAVYHHFFKKKKGDKIRYTASSISHEKNSPLASYEAVFIAKYFDNICLAQFKLSDQPLTHVGHTNVTTTSPSVVDVSSSVSTSSSTTSSATSTVSSASSIGTTSTN